MFKLEKINEFEKLLISAFDDPISNILLKYSHLTVIQFETYIIDLIIDNMSEKVLTYEEKKIYRSNKVSRGSFSRTLSQCRKNIISSMFTILLLNYIGLLEGSPLEEFQTLSNNLHEYSHAFMSSDLRIDSNRLKKIERELLDGIEKLSKPRSLKSM